MADSTGRRGRIALWPLPLAGSAVQRLARAGRLPPSRVLEHAMLLAGGLLVLPGLGDALLAAALGEPWTDRTENVDECRGALIFVLDFVALTALWRRVGLHADIGPGSA
jgi:hypothetical protein